MICVILLLFTTYFTLGGSLTTPTRDGLPAEPQEPSQAVASMELVSAITADSDDDYWNLLGGVWTHIKSSNDVFCRDYPSIGEDIAQFRFRLQIPQGAIIHEATVSLYETSDNGYVGAWIRRINETNVGSLEADTEVPKSVTTNEAIHVFDHVSGEWTTTDITQIVADQVELPKWQSGFYIGLQLNLTGQRVSRNSFEDYQSSGTHHAYIRVKYSEETSWLTGWSYRKSSVIRQTDGGGTNYVLPISVSMGSGTDYDSNVNIEDKALPDFADIRFTASDGYTPLDYYLQEVVDEQTNDHFTDVPVDFANFPGNYPGAYYFNGRTYVVFQGDLDRSGSDLDPHIIYYDHESKTWSGEYYIGYNPAPLKESQDDHGAPCLWVDNQGYINVLYGAHNYNIKYARSQYPEDIRSWVLMPDPVTSFATYPHINYDSVNGVVHLIYRTEYPDRMLSLAYTQSTDDGLTWSSEQIILQFTTEYRWPLVGVTDFDIARQMLHFGVRYRNGTDAIENDEDIYYLRMDVTSKHLFNAQGTDLGTKVDERSELLPLCKVYESGNNYVSGPEVHIDAEGVPYLMFTEESTPEKTWFTHWDVVHQQWFPLQQVSWPGTVAGGQDFIVHSPTNITAFASDNRNIQCYSWDGSTWTWKEQIYDSTKQLSFSLVPIGYNDEVQVVFSEYEGVQTRHHEKMFAWGSGGLVSRTEAKHAKFYVRLPFSLDESDHVIYIYYGNEDATSESQILPISDVLQVLRGPWGNEETQSADVPMIDEGPVLSGQDSNNYLYAKAKIYSISLSVSDTNGFSDIDYISLTLVSGNRKTDYWTLRYYQSTDTFVEYLDSYDYVGLDASSTANITSPNSIALQFKIEINWNQPDVLGCDIRCSIMDKQSYKSLRYYDTNWNIETQLELVGSVGLDDGRGTPDRGDINSLFLASGSVVYYRSSYTPPASEIDVYVVSSEDYWKAMNYDESSGTFTVSVYAGNDVGQTAYRFKVVPKAMGVDASDLLHQVYTRPYITDYIVANLFEDEDASNDTVVTYSLALSYAYDNAPIMDYSVIINKNGVEWRAFANSKGFTVERNLTENDEYTIASANETLYGLTSLEPNYGFLPSGSGSSSGSGMNAKDINVLLKEVAALIREMILFAGTLVIPAVHAVASNFELSVSLASPRNIGIVLVYSSIISVFILDWRRSRKHTRKKVR